MSDDHTADAWGQRGQGPVHVVVDNPAASSGGSGGGAVTDGGGSLTVDDGGGSLTVDGTVAVSNFPATQPVSGTVTANVGTGTQPVSAVSLPLPSGAATDGTDITSPTAMPTGGAGIRGWLSAIFTKLNGTLAVTGAFFQATQPVSLATNTPDVTDRAPRLLGHVTVDTMPTTTVTGTLTANIGTGNLAGITGTVATRALLDTGRTPVVLSATAIASVTSEAMFTLNIWKPSGVTSGTGYTVTTGKTFRIQGIQFGARFTTPSATVTFANCRFNVRSGNLISSPLVYGDSKLCSSNMPTPNSDLPVPDGLEVAAGTVIGVSHVDSATTLSLDLLIVGYEY